MSAWVFLQTLIPLCLSPFLFHPFFPSLAKSLRKSFSCSLCKHANTNLSLLSNYSIAFLCNVFAIPRMLTLTVSLTERMQLKGFLYALKTQPAFLPAPMLWSCHTSFLSHQRGWKRETKTLYHYSCFTNIIKYIYNYSAVLWGHSNTKYFNNCINDLSTGPEKQQNILYRF